jgi:hypothetical protein
MSHIIVYSEEAREEAARLNDTEYLTMLDALGRFYNSEMTQHVGYLITSALGYLALFALAIQAKWIYLLPGLLPSTIRTPTIDAVVVLSSFFILGILYSALPIPPFPLYMLSRVQYYVELSGAVWDHMGITNSNPTYREELKVRIFQRVREGMWGGVNQGVTSLFEARLYLTCCPRNAHADKWKEVFVISDELAKTLEPDTKRIGVWRLKFKIGRLLRIAYRSQIQNCLNEFKRGLDRKTEGWRKGELFSECFDCSSD